MGTSFFDRLKRMDALHRILRVVPSLAPLVRAISSSFYRLLEIVMGTRHPHTRVVQQARRLRAQASGSRVSPSSQDARQNDRRPRVLFFTKRGWFAHVTTEGVLGEALASRGVDVRFFLCGGTLPQCDFKPATDPHVTRPLCWRCTGFGRRFVGSLGFPVTFLADLVTEQEQAHLIAEISEIPVDRLADVVSDDDPLGQWVLPSVQRSLLRGDVDRSEWSSDVYRGFVQSARIIQVAADRILDRLVPDVIVLTNGSFFAERVMLERARRRDVEVVAYERGQPLNSIILDRNRPAVPFKTDELFERWRSVPLSDRQERRLTSYLQDRARGDVGVQDLWPEMHRDGREVLDRLGIDRHRPTAVLYTNVMWDTAVFRRDRAFEGLPDFIFETIKRFADLPETQLVVRVHPAEVRLPMVESRDRIVDRLRDRPETLPPNVTVVPPEDPASSYALMAAARCVIVYTSTIGLEAAARGIPVIVGGDTHYARKGFTLDVDARDHYGGLLRRAMSRQLPGDDPLELAQRYAYTFFFRYQRPFPWVDDSSRADRSLDVGDPLRLAPGHDPEMDELCRWLLEGGELAEPAIEASWGQVPDART